MERYADSRSSRGAHRNCAQVKRPVNMRDLVGRAVDEVRSNAFKFTRHREMGIIKVGARQELEQTIYCVRDGGAGFDMKYADPCSTYSTPSSPG